MVHAGCVFVVQLVGIQLSRSWLSGSFESVWWNACIHKLDLGLYSHPKQFWGNGVRTHVNSKGKIPFTKKNLPRGGSNPQHSTQHQAGQRAQHTTTSYSGPKVAVSNTVNIITWYFSGGQNSSVGSVLGSLSCMMQHHGFDPPLLNLQ